ncbi:MAG: 7-cyano-7-deazaguanine synthase QueC [Hellea sp.]|nr:7-cyano-7-deazaguanine synthase QueC [Hellea sp.]
MNIGGKALLLFSGGQDSATCLAWALSRYKMVETVGFDYDQRHAIELQCRDQVRDQIAALNPEWEKRLGQDHIVDLSVLGEISETSLTRDVEIEMHETGLPSTFVPGRNLIFLNFAAAIGYRRGITTLIGGMCEADFSGYPDCRQDTLDQTMRSISMGMDKTFRLETPLMHISKAGAWNLANELGGQALIEVILEQTHTCYLGERGERQAWGYGCGHCPACDLRAKGWEKFSADQSNR